MKKKGMRMAAIVCSIIIALLAGTVQQTKAQCPLPNTSFKSGEVLEYNLYFNWKFVWVKCGTATMQTHLTKYEGKEAFKADLITRGSKKADKFFKLRDTLTCYTTQDMVPLYYRKAASEGDRYYIDEVWYKYSGEKADLKQHRINHEGKHFWKNATSGNCPHDMLSTFLYARNFDPSDWKEGKLITLPQVDGKKIINGYLKYRGKKVIKGDDGKKYRCLSVSYLEVEDGKQKEIVRFFITDDAYHVPVRLDLFLRFGSAKAFVKSMKNVKGTLTSIVK